MKAKTIDSDDVLRKVLTENLDKDDMYEPTAWKARRINQPAGQ